MTVVTVAVNFKTIIWYNGGKLFPIQGKFYIPGIF